MSSSCEHAVRYILPLYRAFVAKELIDKYNYTQVAVARKIGTTQAAISQYVTSKRGTKRMSNYGSVAPLIKDAATEVAKLLAAEEMNSKEFKDSFCEVCSLCVQSGRKH